MFVKNFFVLLYVICSLLSIVQASDKLTVEEIVNDVIKRDILVEHHRSLISILDEQSKVVREKSKLEYGIAGGSQILFEPTQQKSGLIGYGYFSYILFEEGLRERELQFIDQQKILNIQKTELYKKKQSLVIERNLIDYIRLQISSKQFDLLNDYMKRFLQITKANIANGVISPFVLQKQKLFQDKIEFTRALTSTDLKLAYENNLKYVDGKTLEKMEINLPSLEDFDKKFIDSIALKNEKIIDLQMDIAKLESNKNMKTSYLIPEVKLEGRLGSLEINSRYFDKNIEGELLLIANWNLSKISPRLKENEIISKQKKWIEEQISIQQTVNGKSSTYLMNDLINKKEKLNLKEKFLRKNLEFLNLAIPEYKNGQLTPDDVQQLLLECFDLIVDISQQNKDIWQAYFEIKNSVLI